MPIADIGTANSVRVPPAFFDFRKWAPYARKLRKART